MSDTLYGMVNLVQTEFGGLPSGADRLEYFKTMIDDSASLGSQVVRIPGDWRMLEGRGNDQWSQWYVDETIELIRYAGEKGISVIYGFAQTPDWSRSPTQDNGLWTAPADPAEFAEAAAYLQAQLVSAGVDKNLAAWEIWNEPNVRRYWPDGELRNPALAASGVDIAVNEEAAKRYVDMLNATYDALKSVDPNVTVLGGALAGTDVEYVEWMMNYSAKFDGLSFHPYTRPYDNNDPAPGQLDAGVGSLSQQAGASLYLNERWSFQYGIERIHDLLTENGRSGEMWITEVGWRLPDDDTEWLYVPDEEAQAAYLQKALELVNGWDFIKAFTVFSLYDTPDGDFGLLDADGSWRQSAHIFRDFIDSLSNSAEGSDSTAVAPDNATGSKFVTVIESMSDDGRITGTANNDVLIGTEGNDVLNGASGDDVLIGSFGNDVFEYRASSGIDYARDFNAIEDIAMIDREGIESFGDIQPLLQQWGPNTAVYFDKENQLILEFVDLDDLTADNFAFAGVDSAP